MTPEIHKGMNQGNEIAGIIEEVGSNVVEFKAIALQHSTRCIYTEARTPNTHLHGVIRLSTCLSMPSFEEAATIPLATLTAAVSLYAHLRFPPPWRPAVTPMPSIVFGASTVVGSYAIRLACNSNIHPIITIAAKASQYVRALGQVYELSGQSIVSPDKLGVLPTSEGTGSSVQDIGGVGSGLVGGV
ncbi:hypothetical protein BDV33DRAFT_209084 [Aspergillus novoparasiticus]|uniref:Uncharacterized protein n=1 Tax=Aspergillus novoparasiticus TaxID=986946 RepID=A0A5N6EB86_9EURO|nr:hypothetical protein BDV33DRAFT_209084 [Aspergillus novoparasiticus]